MNTQEELELCSVNNAPVPANVRPDNPLVHVLNENDNSEGISEIPDRRRSRRRSISPLLEPSQPKRQKKLKELTKFTKITEECSHETVSQIEDFIKTDDQISSKLPESNSKALENINDGNIETLSQIEAFIKKPVEKNYSKTRDTKRLTDVNKDSGETSRLSIYNEKLKLINIIQSKKPAKRRLSEQGDSNISAEKVQTVNMNNIAVERDKSITQIKSEEEGNCSYNEKDVVKSDVDQSFALLESKSTKSRKKDTDSILPDFRVTVTSHRRSMNIAATSETTSSNSSSHHDSSSSTRGKRKLAVPKKTVNNESDSSNVEVSKKKPSRGRSKVYAENKTNKGKTKVVSSEDNSETNSRPSKEPRGIRSSSRRTAAKSSEKNKEGGDAFEEGGIEISKPSKKAIKFYSGSTLEENTSASEDNATSENFKAISQRKKQTRNTNSKKSVDVAGAISSGRSIAKSSTESSIESINDFEEKCRSVSNEDMSNAGCSKSKEIMVQTSDDDAAIPRKENKPQTPVRGGRRTTQRTKYDKKLNQESSSDSNTSVKMTTPRKQKSVSMEHLLNSAERVKRKLKPKVVFTMMDDPQLESLIRQLGKTEPKKISNLMILQI